MGSWKCVKSPAACLSLPRVSVVLKPGSYHVMLIGLKKPLKDGETIPLTLDFEKAGKVSITVPIRWMGAGT